VAVGIGDAHPGSVRVEEESSVLFWTAAALLVLNLIDGVLTLIAVDGGGAAEANPLMRLSLGLGALAFILIKIVVVSGGVLFLWRARQRVLAVAGLVTLNLLYVGVLAYHVTTLPAWASRL
jgi:hypothetical protein